MTSQTAQAYATDPVKISTVTKRACIFKVICRVVEGIVWSGPLGRVCITNIMTFDTFAARTGCTEDPNIEPRVVAGASGLPMAVLTNGQVRFSHQSMLGRV